MPSESTAIGNKDAPLEEKKTIKSVLPQNAKKAAMVAQVLDQEGLFEAQIDKEFFQK